MAVRVNHTTMISYLVGQLVEKSTPWLVIEVNGVGYDVQASLNTFTDLPALGAEIKLLTHFVKPAFLVSSAFPGGCWLSMSVYILTGI